MNTRRVAIVTGSRADFGLLDPVIARVTDHPQLEGALIACGAHLLAPEFTVEQVRAKYPLAACTPMQLPDLHGRAADAEALGRGVGAMARLFRELKPDWVMVLGDRIEAFAAGAAACVGGWSLAHIHGGDRAEGIADESMRHAISKMANLHLAATASSAERLVRMGEDESRVHVVGSPAMIGLDRVAPLDDAAFGELGAPEVVVLLHPMGRDDATEQHAAEQVIRAIGDRPMLALAPNHDPGRDGICRAIDNARVPTRTHLPRDVFLGLLARIKVLVGNSSAGLIEASAVGSVGRATVNIGDRQRGRERGAHLIDAPERAGAIADAIDQATSLAGPFAHPFGPGDADVRIADLLASIDPHDGWVRRKMNTY